MSTFDHKGFTLIEIMVSTFIFVMIMIVLFNIYKGYYTVFDIQQARTAVNGSASTVIKEFGRVARQADHVAGSHVFSGVTYTSGVGVAVFELPSLDSSGDIIAGTYDYIAFYATSTSSYVITDAGSGSARGNGTRHLSDTLNTLTFTYSTSTMANATSTDIDVLTQKIVRGQTLQAHLHQTVRLRNI